MAVSKKITKKQVVNLMSHNSLSYLATIGAHELLIEEATKTHAKVIGLSKEQLRVISINHALSHG